MLLGHDVLYLSDFRDRSKPSILPCSGLDREPKGLKPRPGKATAPNPQPKVARPRAKEILKHHQKVKDMWHPQAEGGCKLTPSVWPYRAAYKLLGNTAKPYAVCGMGLASSRQSCLPYLPSILGSVEFRWAHLEHRPRFPAVSARAWSRGTMRSSYIHMSLHRAGSRVWGVVGLEKGLIMYHGQYRQNRRKALS